MNTSEHPLVRRICGYYGQRVALIAGISFVALCTAVTKPAAAPFFFSTGDVTNQIATGSRPPAPGKIEIETADDFILTAPTTITKATVTGVVPASFTVGELVVSIYRVFPNDSTNPPSGSVPTRVNSPADNEILSRDSAVAGELTFSTTVLNPSFTASNSVLNGVNKIPNQTTGGEGAVTGQEVQFNVTFTNPILLGSDHYFFVPQVLLASGDFRWLSASRPISASGTPFVPDLQTWMRNANLDPDWLRIGADIVGGSTPPTFNTAFTLTGTTPEARALELLAIGLAGLGWLSKHTARFRGLVHRAILCPPITFLW